MSTDESIFAAVDKHLDSVGELLVNIQEHVLIAQSPMVQNS